MIVYLSPVRLDESQGFDIYLHYAYLGSLLIGNMQYICFLQKADNIRFTRSIVFNENKSGYSWDPKICQ